MSVSDGGHVMLRFTVTLLVMVFAILCLMGLIGAVGLLELLLAVVIALGLTLIDARRRKGKAAEAQTQ